jgi:ribosome biogenesis protein Tsr3
VAGGGDFVQLNIIAQNRVSPSSRHNVDKKQITYTDSSWYYRTELNTSTANIQ